LKIASLTQLLYRMVTKTIADGVTDLASSIAFFVCFGIFPLLLAVLSAIGWWMDSDDTQARFRQFLDSIFPATSTDLILAQVESIMHARGSMGVAGVLALLWSASSAFGAISRAINRAQGAPNPRNYVLSRLSYFLMAVVATLLVLVSLAISIATELLFANEQQLMSLLGLAFHDLSRAGARVTTFGITLLVFALIYREAPHQKLAWRYVWPGALFAAVFNEIANFCFIWYLGHASNMELVFGSLTSIMVLLMWFYISAIGLIVGFECNLILADESTSA
jgi:membrane protein